MSQTSLALVGLSVLGTLANPPGPNSLGIVHSLILQGKYDDELTAAMERIHGDEASKALDNLKNVIRTNIQHSLYAFMEDQSQNVLDEIKSNNQPHPEGTTAELADKLGMSKKQVRKLKATGKLDEALRTIAVDN